MTNSDLDTPQATMDIETKKRELKLVNKLCTVEDMLKKKYFFTQKQIYDILNKNTDHDGYFYEQIIHDAEQKFSTTMPLSIPITTYIYNTLMDIESLDMEERNHDISTSISDMIQNSDTPILSYEQFVPQIVSSDDAWKQMKAFVKEDVQDFYVVHIDEHVGSESLPVNCLTDLKPNMNLYIFVQKDTHTFIVRSPIGSMNDCLDVLAKKYSATRVTVPIFHFFEASK